MKAPRDAGAHYPIRVVSKLTGIAIDTLRAWERRYGAVTPGRDDRGRVYTDADVARLRLINQAVAAGHSIGRVAGLSDAALNRLAAAQPVAPPVPSTATTLERVRFSAALFTLDTVAIDHECARLAAVMPPLELLREVIFPSLREAGEVWNTRPGGIAQEHVISATVRHLLGSFLRLYGRRDAPVRLLFATPAGDRHEIGILGAAMLAANHGLGISYIGPDLPAGEIVEAVKAARAQVLVLGVTLAKGGPATGRALAAILRGLPPGVELWVGGPAATRHAKALGRHALILPDFDSYVQQLARLGT